jgi:hypothetical protein
MPVITASVANTDKIAAYKKKRKFQSVYNMLIKYKLKKMKKNIKGN